MNPSFGNLILSPSFSYDYATETEMNLIIS